MGKGDNEYRPMATTNGATKRSEMAQRKEPHDEPRGINGHKKKCRATVDNAERVWHGK